MNLSFINIGSFGMLLIFLVAILLIIGVGNYGRNTALGYWGSVLLAIFTTPLIAFIVILFLRYRKTA